MKINWKGLLLWSNQFYGICAVALSIESCLMILGKFPTIPVLLFIHLSTVIYYTHAYFLESKDGIYNERSKWYTEHKKYLYARQSIYTGICIYLGLVTIPVVTLLSNVNWFLFFIFILTLLLAILYYLPSLFPALKNSIRKFGIIKSVSIAWVWAIACCILPIWLSPSIEKTFFQPLIWLHTIELFIFIFILAILFDIKDMQSDQSESVITLVVKIGKDRIVNNLIVPSLIVFTLVVCIVWYQLPVTILFLYLQLLLVCLLYFVSKLVINVQSIFKNILLIDGLMIIKAILSIGFFWR